MSQSKCDYVPYKCNSSSHFTYKTLLIDRQFMFIPFRVPPFYHEVRCAISNIFFSLETDNFIIYCIQTLIIVVSLMNNINTKTKCHNWQKMMNKIIIRNNIF